MIQTFQLLPGITLRCFPDSRFKQGCLSLQILRPMCKEEAATNALLPAVLLRGCESAPDLRQITLRLDDLYGASIGALVRRVGDYQATGFYCGFIDDRFALESDSILQPLVEFVSQLLFRPVLEEGVFCREFVESEKRNLIAAIQSRRNDKRVYASDRLMSLMCKADSFGIPRLGEPEQVSAIDAASAYHHYQRILKESPIDLFYVGAADPAGVAALLKPIFQAIERNYIPLPPQTAFQDGGCAEEEEILEVTQGKLAIGYVTPITLRDPEFAAMQVCNTVLGAGMTSKLFMNVREKHSLCYDIGSGYHGSKGIMAVSAGIDFDKKDIVCQHIEEQLRACRENDITLEELNAAKEALLNSLRGVHDSPSAIEGYYATAALSGMGMTPDQYMEAVEKVMISQVASAAATLKQHTIYFLKGVR